jgi:hypothetical protein
MLVGEYRMIDDLQDGHPVNHPNHFVNRMIRPRMVGGGEGRLGGEFL